MTKRFHSRGAAAGSGFVTRRSLDVLINSTEKKLTAEEIVDDLRSRERDVARLNRQTLLRYVEQVLRSRNKRMKEEDDVDDDDDGDKDDSEGTDRKKKQRRQRNLDGSMSSSWWESASASSEADGGVSTSEDAMQSEKSTRQLDLINHSYAKLCSSLSKSKGPLTVEKNVESKTATARCNGEGLGAKKEVKDGPRFKDLGGIESVLDALMTRVIVPLYHPRQVQHMGAKPSAGILLYGPPGCGKTTLARAIANETGVSFYMISATELVSGVSGESEENIRELFSKAYRTAPSIVFIDEIDAIASKRENQQREMEKRTVTQLLACMDESHRPDKIANADQSDSQPDHVLVIGATNRPNALDPALRRPGRFDREIYLGFPDENARAKILSIAIRDLKLEGPIDIARIARLTPGFVGTDLVAVANEAGLLAVRRMVDARKPELSRYTEEEKSWLVQPFSPEETENIFVTPADFEKAVETAQPSSKREGFSEVPDVKWEDVGGLDHIRQELDSFIVGAIKRPEAYEKFRVDMETAFLLYGPPGCGKTLIAKAVANEAGANYIYVKGPELLNKYVGESERAVRTLFSRARACSPCVLFFDEVDSWTTKRGNEGALAVDRVVDQLILELQGAEPRPGVFVIGATNRPDAMDPALLRPGRFGKHLYVQLPTADERASILRSLARKKPVDASVDLNAIAKMEACENLSGADLAKLVNEAAMAAVREELMSRESCLDTIQTYHFEQALAKISPSVSKQQLRHYEDFSKTLSSDEGRNTAPRIGRGPTQCSVFGSSSGMTEDSLKMQLDEMRQFIFSMHARMNKMNKFIREKIGVNPFVDEDSDNDVNG